VVNMTRYTGSQGLNWHRDKESHHNSVWIYSLSVRGRAWFHLRGWPDYKVLLNPGDALRFDRTIEHLAGPPLGNEDRLNLTYRVWKERFFQ
jgi:hypothetical protein